MSKDTVPDPQPDMERPELAANEAIGAYGGDAREAVKAPIVVNEFLDREIEEKVSRGFLRGAEHGRFNTYSA